MPAMASSRAGLEWSWEGHLGLPQRRPGPNYFEASPAASRGLAPAGSSNQEPELEYCTQAL